MKNLLLIIILLFGFNAHASELVTHVFPAEITRVVDGDTMDMKIDLSLGIILNKRIRVRDLDTPETWRPQNEAEANHGKRATAYAVALFKRNNNKVLIRVHGYGVYNRIEADIYLPQQGNRSYADIMKENGFQKRESYD